MKVVIIGSGNVATVLSRLIQKAGHEIIQVVSRNKDHAVILASGYNANAGSLLDEQFDEAEIYIIALSDAALETIEKLTALNNKFVVHTAGSISKNVLKALSSSYGVLYPLQTLSKITEQIPEIPFLVEGNNQETLDRITEFAKTLSPKVIPVTEAERLHYHIAAVFAGNFTNHMYALAENFCEMEKIDFKNLLPLINEVTQKANNNSPHDVQTGPAMREDIFTINRHLQELSSHAEIKYLYLKLSESILKFHEKH
jgi:predicted short-subunit dehydrogenase-like oxidoreductase (DUF2520 family)